MSWYVPKTVFYTKPIEDQKWPKVASCLVIDIFCVLQNFNISDPQSSPKACQSLKKLVNWPKILNFFIVTTSDLLKNAYFPLFDVKMVTEIWGIDEMRTTTDNRTTSGQLKMLSAFHYKKMRTTFFPNIWCW